MKTVNFHGEVLPAVGMGTWHMGSTPSNFAHEKAVLQYGLKNGATVIDTAEMYGEGDAEILVGEAIQGFKREDIFIISKFYPSNASSARLQQALANSLQRLQTDYIDLYLLHWRTSEPYENIVADLERFKAQGKIRHWGVSNLDIADMQELVAVPQGTKVFANQNLYNLGNRGMEYDLIPWQEAHNIPLIAYAPIDQGDTRGKGLSKHPVVQVIAEAHKATTFQILLAWTLRNGQTLAIPQTSNIAHLQANIDAANIELSEVELAQLDAAFPAPTHKMPLAII